MPASEETSSLSFENLEGSYPYECIDRNDLKPGSIVAVHTEVHHAGKRLFYGDTCLYGQSGFRTL